MLLKIGNFQKTASFKAKQPEPKLIAETPYLQLKSSNDWSYAHRPKGSKTVIVVPLIEEFNPKTGKHEDYIIYAKTYREGLNAERIAIIDDIDDPKQFNCIELPGGDVGDQDTAETVEEAAGKELLEETGYEADKIEILANGLASSPGLTTEHFSVAIAKGLTKTETVPSSDNGTIRGIEKKPLREFMDFLVQSLEKGKAVSAQTTSAMAFVCNKMFSLSNSSDK